MNAMTPEIFWQRLRQQAVVDGDMPSPRTSSPWYVRIMLGFAGWIGALFLLAFVGVGFVFVMENAAAAVLVSLLCCGAAWVAFRFAPDNDLVTQFALAMSMAGQGMFLIGMFEAFDSERAASVFFAAATYELALALLLPNFLHRVISSSAAGVALAYAVSGAAMDTLVPVVLAGMVAVVFLNWRRWAARATFWAPLAYGSVLALLLIELMQRVVPRWLFNGNGMTMPDWWFAYAYLIDTVLMAVVLLVTVSCLLRDQHIALASRAGLAVIGAALLVAVASLWAPGLTTALLILLLGFGCGNRVLQGVGALALLAFLSDFYYSLHATLLFKSGLLAASGLLLLGGRLAMHRFIPQQEAASAAPDAASPAVIDTEGNHA